MNQRKQSWTLKIERKEKPTVSKKVKEKLTTQSMNRITLDTYLSGIASTHLLIDATNKSDVVGKRTIWCTSIPFHRYICMNTEEITKTNGRKYLYWYQKLECWCSKWEYFVKLYIVQCVYKKIPQKKLNRQHLRVRVECSQWQLFSFRSNCSISNHCYKISSWKQEDSIWANSIRPYPNPCLMNAILLSH